MRAALALALLAAASVAAQEPPPGSAPEPGGAAETAPSPRPRPAERGIAPSPVEVAPAEPLAPDPAPPGVHLRALDKFSGLATRLGVEIGGTIRYERLSVTVRACESGAQGDVAFLVIVDDRDPAAPVFSGWMFAETPALSALDHPRYDVWLASCNTRSGGAD